MSSKKKKYLLIPAKPAANGGLHLGHLSGPYMRLDLLYRQLEIQGHQVHMIFGVDAHDSFVLKRAQVENTSPEKISEVSYKQIKKDLETANIKVDLFVNPVSSEYSELFSKHHIELLKQLQSLGFIEDLEEQIPLDQEGKMRFGSDLHGNCPKCNDGIAGYFCEACGFHFKPEEVINPSFDQQPLINTTSKDNLFFSFPDKEALIESWNRAGLREDFKHIGEQFLKANSHFRMTTPTVWGLDWPDQKGQTLFGHGLLYAYCRFIGDLYKNLTREETHPFDQESEVICVNGFGVDNTVSHVVGIQSVAQAIPKFKGFDHFVINYFYLLEKEKFSTSRQHAIWIRDLAEQDEITMDGVRYYLSLKNPVYGIQNLDVDDFISTYNTLFESCINPLIERVKLNHTLDKIELEHTPSVFIDRFTIASTQMNQYLSIASFNPQLAAELFKDWCRQISSVGSSTDNYWWTKAAVFLMHPLMPSIAAKLLPGVGVVGAPLYEKFEHLDEIEICNEAPVAPITRDAFEPLLPKSHIKQTL